mmetsp:Transcript_85706/g.245983  ORF Transcript_85706/g.245983 Transcript_85706/m.245983 type:complete len:222 (+) Transcript_85706:855-1520(+)
MVLELLRGHVQETLLLLQQLPEMGDVLGLILDLLLQLFDVLFRLPQRLLANLRHPAFLQGERLATLQYIGPTCSRVQPQCGTQSLKRELKLRFQSPDVMQQNSAFVLQLLNFSHVAIRSLGNNTHALGGQLLAPGAALRSGLELGVHRRMLQALARRRRQLQLRGRGCILRWRCWLRSRGSLGRLRHRRQTDTLARSTGRSPRSPWPVPRTLGRCRAPLSR